jgi:hypothetical protein
MKPLSIEQVYLLLGHKDVVIFQLEQTIKELQEQLARVNPTATAPN